MASEAEFAWAVGLFEGEGYISILNHKVSSKPYQSAQLGLGTTDQDVAEKFFEIMGVGHLYFRDVSGDKPGKKRKPVWRWCLCKRGEIKDLLERMMPLLGERRQARAREILALIEGG